MAAEEELRTTGGANLTAAGLRDLILRATGDEREAGKAYSARRMAELDRPE